VVVVLLNSGKENSSFLGVEASPGFTSVGAGVTGAVIG